MSCVGVLRPTSSPRPVCASHAATGAPASKTASKTGTFWWREALLLGALYGLYELSRRLVVSDPARAMTTGRAVLSWERSVHLDPEVSINHLVSSATAPAVVAAYFYATLHYVVTPAVLIWLYRRHPQHYAFARTSLAFGTGLGLIGFYLIPTAPPRLLPYGGIRDTLAQVHNYGWWSGEGSVPRGLGGLSNQFAAMPSLHVGWAAWSGVLIAAYASHRWVRLLGAAYPIATILVVLGTGNHYLLDAAAGIAVMALGALVALTLTSAARYVRRATTAQIATPPNPADLPLASESCTRAATVATRRPHPTDSASATRTTNSTALRQHDRRYERSPR